MQTLRLLALYIIFFSILVNISYAQQKIKGSVTDAETHEPLIGVNILKMDDKTGATTDQEGNYSISIEELAGKLRFSYIGYSTQIVSINGSSEIDIQLQPSFKGLDEIIVTGTAGEARKRTIGNSISRVDASDILSKTSRSSVTDLLQSEVPGLTISAGSGTVGSAPNIQTRGLGTLNANTNPIIYVDGIKINSGTVGNFSVYGQSTTGLDAVNPQNIKSIEVIKGPAAATLYGAEAASGVIQIITKNGSRGEQNLQWNFHSEGSRRDWPKKWRPKNYTVCTQSRIDSPDNWPGCSAHDAGDILSNTILSAPKAQRKGFGQEYTLSARGGGEEYSYYLSGNYGTQEGVLYPNSSKGGGLRTNFNVFLADNLDLGVALRYSNRSLQLPLGDNHADAILLSSALGAPGRYYAGSNTTGYLTTSPEQYNTYDNTTKTDRYILGGHIGYDPFEWFDNTLNIGFDLSNGRAELYYAPNTPLTAYGLVEENGAIEVATPSDREFTLDYNGTIKFNINRNFTSNTSVGAQYLSSVYSRISASGEDLGSSSVTSLSAAAITHSDESYKERKSLGFYLQEKVGYKDLLYITGAVRMDNNSAFGAEINSIFYPKLSASYVISDQDFFDVSFINELRLRAAWGQAGRSPGAFDAVRTYGTTPATLPDQTSVSALQYVSYGNPDLKPERATEIEAGFDASLLQDDRLEIEATLYHSKTEDALVVIPTAPSLGFGGTRELVSAPSINDPGAQLQNLGTIQNMGIELGLNVTPIAISNFRIDSRISFSANKNELVSLGEDRSTIRFGVYSLVQRFQEGYPIGAYWADRVKREANGNVVKTDAGDPVLEDEQIYKGPSRPTRTAGFSTTFTLFGNLQLFAMFDYKGGHYLFNVKDWRRDRSSLSWATTNPNADPDEVLVRNYPRQTALHIQPADFIKFRDLSLTYKLPTEWLDNLNIANASISIRGHNLAIWTQYGGPDPEINFHGADAYNKDDAWTLPMSRSFSATVDIGF